MPARARILVTNWSVHSASARELVTDLFRRQAADPKLTRGEALRQAMMALIDGTGFTDDDGKTLFTYAPSAVLGALHHHRRRRPELTVQIARRHVRAKTEALSKMLFSMDGRITGLTVVR